MDTSTTMANFGSLRSLLHAPPTGTSWALICSQLVQFSSRQLEDEILPYLLDHFARAPATSLHRPLPRAWARMFTRTLPSSSLLCTINDLTLHESFAEPDTLSELSCYLRDHIEQIPVERIELQGDVGPRKVMLALLEKANRPTLTHLALHHTPYFSGRMQELVDAIPETLTSLSLHQEDLADASILRHLLERLPHLEHLSLTLPRDVSTSVDLVTSLVEWRYDLQSLELIGATHVQGGLLLPVHSFEMLGSSDGAHLFAREWPSLRKLSLRHWNIPPEAVSRGPSFQLPSLQHFELEGGAVSDAAILGLMEALDATPLTSLRITSTHATRQSLHALTTSARLRERLTHLSLANNRHTLTEEDQQELFATRPWSALRTLHLGHVDLTASRADLLEDDLGEPTFPALEKLTLSSCPLSPELFYALTRSALPSLHTALFQGSSIWSKTPDMTSDAIRNRQLLSASWLDQLEHLHMPNIAFTNEALRALSERSFPGLKSMSFDTSRAEQLRPFFTRASWLEHLHLLQPDAPSLPYHASRIARPYLDLLAM